MKNFNKLLLLSFLLLTMSIAYGQEKAVTGKVYAFKDTPLKNVTIVSKKSKQEVLSDEYGNFSIEVAKNDKLVFTGAGFEKHIERVKAGQKLNLKLYFLGGASNEKVAVGQGVVTESSLLFAKSNFLEYNNKNHTYTDIWMLLQGQFPGVQILPKDGGAGKKVVIRDAKWLSGRSNEAMYIVDGQIWQDISVIQPMEVKTVKVMKDGASLGFRAVNGAVIITTIDEIGKTSKNNSRQLKRTKTE